AADAALACPAPPGLRRGAGTDAGGQTRAAEAAVAAGTDAEAPAGAWRAAGRPGAPSKSSLPVGVRRWSDSLEPSARKSIAPTAKATAPAGSSLAVTSTRSTDRSACWMDTVFAPHQAGEWKADNGIV